MQKSPAQLCHNHSENSNENKYSETKYLQDELSDLKLMLEMQEIINHELEEKLQKVNEEKQNLINEKNDYNSKIYLLEKELEEKMTEMQMLQIKIQLLTKDNSNLHQKVEEQYEKIEWLTEDNTNLHHSLEDVQEKVEWLTRENTNLCQTLEKKEEEFENLKNQLEDERTFYAEEKSLYCKEMKRRRNHTTEVQTESTPVDDESVCTQSGDESKQIRLLKALFRFETIKKCLACEKYMKLLRYTSVLFNRLSYTSRVYKKAMVDVMLEFDECKAEYNALLEDKYNEDGPHNPLKIVNRSNRLASDNAVLKQELVNLNNQLSLIRRNSNNDSTILPNYGFTSDRGKKDDNDGRIHTDHSNSTKSKKKPKRQKNKTKRKSKNHFDSDKKHYSTGPASSDNTSSDYSENEVNTTKTLKNSEFENKLEFSGISMKTYFSSSTSCSSDCSKKNENDKSKNSDKKSKARNKINKNSSCSEESIIKKEYETNNEKNKILQNNEKTGLDEPACIPVTCDDKTGDLKINSQATKTIPEETDDVKPDILAWLAKTPTVIDCGEWSNSVQGNDVSKAESAPELITANF